MRILMTGGRGFIGSALSKRLVEAGHEIIHISRTPRTPQDIAYASDELSINLPKDFVCDAVIHLAGEPIASKRWSKRQKDILTQSRVELTSKLAKALTNLSVPPRIFLGASAIGYYGDRGSQLVTEQSGEGTGFLAELGHRWEAASAPLATTMRRVSLRFGIVLASHGGALNKLLLPYRLGLAGKLGSGEQWMSWVSLIDTVAAIEFCLLNEEIHGPVNITAPNPVTNAEFTHTLARALKRPAIFSVPAYLLKFLLGHMAKEILLASCRAIPSVLLRSGFDFQHHNLVESLHSILSKKHS